MVEENQIGELAVIFNRLKATNDKVESFVPVKVVEGYYCEEEKCFIDSEQNVYSHITSTSKIGNVFASRIDIIEILNEYKDLSINKLKEQLLIGMMKYDYIKNIDETAEEYCQIKAHDRETNEVVVFCDKDTPSLDETEESQVTTSKVKAIEKKVNEEDLTPNDIANQIKKSIKGQDEIIDKIATLIWVKYNMPKINKTNMFVVGESAVGKTSLFKKLRDTIDIPLTIYPLSDNLNGYEIYEMLTQLYYDSDRDIEKAENGIIVIDNFDKICCSRNDDEIEKIIIQNELLKLFNGCVKTFAIDEQTIINIDTSNITFICCGNILNKKRNDKAIGFEPFENKRPNSSTKTILDKSGIISELLNTSMVVVELNDINKDKATLKEIILNSEDSVFHQISESFASYGIKIINFDSVIDIIIEETIEKGLTIRSIINVINNILLKVIEKIGNNPGKYNRLIIGNNIVNDPQDFFLLPQKIKIKRKLKQSLN